MKTIDIAISDFFL